MKRYPTKEEILGISYKLKPIHVWLTLTWKKSQDFKNWKKLVKENKTTTLIHLVDLLNLSLPIKERVKQTIKGNIYCYTPANKKITLDRNNPSIMSTLHEFGHHLLGSDELDACVWSVNLFKECFPKAFQKLEWKGHMLVKKNET